MMKILVDSHVFIWMDSKPNLLSPTAAAAIQDPANTVYLSVASAWELLIKWQTGKLTLRLPLDQIIAEQQQKNNMQILTIILDHTLAVGRLPSIHRDPFDRMLAAQAEVEQAHLVTADPILSQYPISILW